MVLSGAKSVFRMGGGNTKKKFMSRTIPTEGDTKAVSPQEAFSKYQTSGSSWPSWGKSAAPTPDTHSSSTPTTLEPEEEEGRPTTELMVGVPKEVHENEKRVATTPTNVKAFVKEGYTVMVERGSGEAAGFSDSDYQAAGARMLEKEQVMLADIVLKVRAPEMQANGVHEATMMKQGAHLISFIQPGTNPELVELLCQQQINTMAMDKVPRISRAQVFDALSSMAGVAGYKAVIEAANQFGRYFTGQMTAAGKIPPAKVLVIGAGVAGLQAIATAKSMGAIVRAFDTRPIVKEQVQSFGAEFLEIQCDEDEGGETKGGYAKETSKAFHEAEIAMFTKQCREVDIIITTAMIPGRPAPKLITEPMIGVLKSGSVIVDLAAEFGGNSALTVKNERIVTPNGVVIVGYTDLPSRLPTQSSTLYSNNIGKLLLSMSRNGKDGKEFTVNFSDEVIRGALIVWEGETLPPPEARPVTTQQAKPKEQPVVVEESPEEKALGDTVGRVVMWSVGLGGLLVAGATVPASYLPSITTFTLATLIGVEAVSSVVPALHSPLMSVTNAVSGAVVISGMSLMGGGILPSTISQGIASVAVIAASVNIVGGFKVTSQSLDSFRKPGQLTHSWMWAIPTGMFTGGYILANYYNYANLAPVGYLAASILCVASIHGLSKQSSAQQANAMGMCGIFTGVAVSATSLWSTTPHIVFAQMALCMALGGGMGFMYASGVAPTDLPQTVAGYHTLVGAAAVLVSYSSFLLEAATLGQFPIQKMAIYLGALIGGITTTGSIVAFGKLNGNLSSKALNLPGKEVLNIIMAGGLVAMGGLYYVAATEAGGLLWLSGGTLVSLLMGWHLTDSIGGADMTVAVTILNSYSGWALVTEGFLLDNSMLLITGSLIGASGALLTIHMCKAMNRSLTNVVFGGIGNKPKRVKAEGEEEEVLEHTTVTNDEVLDLIQEAQDIIVVPGYGMATADAQFAVSQIWELLKNHGTRLRFAIHPVAGRMPGQMNLLLANANVDYEAVEELDTINDDFAKCDLVLVIGANDIVNSGAIDDPDSPIAGMPVLKVWEAPRCIVMKRSMGGVGYAGVDNPIFFKPKTSMLFGNAKENCEILLSKLKEHYSQ